VPKRRGVEQHRQRIEALPGLDLLVVEQMLLASCHVPIMPLHQFPLVAVSQAEPRAVSESLQREEDVAVPQRCGLRDIATSQPTVPTI
jgi:hypothetical protein